MLVAAAALWALMAPQHAAPDDDPVRVTLYGRPEDMAIADLAASPAAHVGRAVRVRGRFERQGGHDRVCQERTCLRLVPEQGLAVVLAARAARWQGQELDITGVLMREDAPAPARPVSAPAPADAAFALRFWRVGAARNAEAAALPGTPITLESLVYAGGSRDGQLVRVQGVFRGRNLHADLPPASQRGNQDWVVKDDYYAVWVTGQAPEGPGWKLDPTALDDTRSWVEISGRPQTRRGFVYLRAEQVAPLAPPVAAEAVAPPPTAGRARMPPPVVVFAMPLETEELSAGETRLLIQFSKHMDPTTFAGRVRLRYGEETAAFEPARLTYDASRRTLLVETGPLSPGRALECLLLEGLIDVHGQALVPRQGAIVGGVVDVLRYRVAAAESGDP